MRQLNVNGVRAFFLPFVLAQCLFAGQMPAITGTTLAGNKMALPDAAHGHIAILCIGFSHASQHQIRPWVERINSLPHAKSVQVYQVAELQDAPRFVHGMIVRGMKNDVPAAEHDHFLVIYEHEKELKNAVGFTASDDAYILLLDQNGAIAMKTHGPVDEPALSQLADRIEALESKGTR